MAPMSINNHDAQWIDSQKLSVDQVAAVFNLPPFKLGSMENSAVRANLEEQNKDYFQTSLSRWMNRFREESDYKLIGRQDYRSERRYFKWFPEKLLAGSTKDQYESFLIGRTGGWLSPNEIREFIGLNSIGPEGDTYENPNTSSPDASSDPADDTEVEPLKTRKRKPKRSPTMCAACWRIRWTASPSMSVAGWSVHGANRHSSRSG